MKYKIAALTLTTIAIGCIAAVIQFDIMPFFRDVLLMTAGGYIGVAFVFVVIAVTGKAL